MFSVLENARLKSAGEDNMPDWKEAFHAFLKREKQTENLS
jgi:dTDP-4-dehydrorhamnose reductase